MINRAGVRERARRRRHLRVRKKVQGTLARPRLAVFKSLNHIYGQLIDDEHGRTLAAASSLSTAFQERAQGIDKASGGNIEGAKIVGTLLAEQALAKGITRVVFDRGGFLYHGRVKAVADAARATGLEF